MQGNTGFLTEDMAKQRQVDINDDLVDRFPPVLVNGYLVHVFEERGAWRVWLNTEDMAFTGLCIGAGSTREIAVAQAIAALEAASAHLKQPAK